MDIHADVADLGGPIQFGISYSRSTIHSDFLVLVGGLNSYSSLQLG